MCVCEFETCTYMYMKQALGSRPDTLFLTVPTHNHLTTGLAECMATVDI